MVVFTVLLLQETEFEMSSVESSNERIAQTPLSFIRFTNDLNFKRFGV